VARRPAPAWAPRAAGWLALAGLVVAVAVAAPRLGEAWDEFRNPPAEQVTNEPGRLTELSSNHRWTWWTQAWQIFREDPLAGSGAGTYELARRPIRRDTLGPIDPHNLGLKALSDMGAVGFLVLLGTAAAGVAVAVGAIRRTSGEERAAAAALAAGAAAWLAQALLDMPWEYAAATVPMLFGLGVLATAGRPRAARAGSGRSAAAFPLALAIALVGSLSFPWLAQRRLETSLGALSSADFGAALAAAQDAGALNPVAVAPLELEGTALELMERPAEARTVYVRAVRLQPRNSETWYELGRFEYEQGELARALLYLDRAWGLDPLSPDTGPLLDRVRADIARQASR
jgi:O-antigen ligase